MGGTSTAPLQGHRAAGTVRVESRETEVEVEEEKRKEQLAWKGYSDRISFTHDSRPPLPWHCRQPKSVTVQEKVCEFLLRDHQKTEIKNEAAVCVRVALLRKGTFCTRSYLLSEITVVCVATSTRDFF